jgi:small redox-active disulfide protein 2
MTEKKKIQVVGAGCKKCKKLLENTEEAVKQLNITEEFEVEYVTEVEKFADLDVFITPALRVDGKVVSEGKLLSIERIKEFF